MPLNPGISSLTRAELWRRIFILSEHLSAIGQTLPQRATHIWAQVTSDIPPNQEDAETLKLYRSAQYAPLGFSKTLKVLLASHGPLTDHELRMREVLMFGLHVDGIFAKDKIMGNRKALERACRSAGLIAEIKETLEEWESECCCLQEQSDERSLEYEEAQKDLEARIQRGEVQRDASTGLLYGFDHLESVGPAIQVADISRLVTASKTAETRCPICLETFNDVGKVVELVCGHVCDAECLSQWINSTAERANTCILCRNILFDRRPRRPVHWYSHYCDVQEAVTGSERELGFIREDLEQLSQLLYLVAPGEVTSHALGHQTTREM